jgi:hypothetical protein
MRTRWRSAGVMVEEAEELPLAHAALDSLASFFTDPGSRRERRARKRRRH